MAKEGDRVRVVGMPGYEDKIGTVIGFTGSGLSRIRLDRTGVVVGADKWQMRALTGDEAVAAENLPPVQAIVQEMRQKGWQDAANLLARRAKDFGLR